MSVTPTVRVLSAEEIASRAGGGDIPFLRIADQRSFFAEREMRLRQRAFGHPMHDFLLFIAELARAQQQQVNTLPAPAPVTQDTLLQAARAGLAPLPAADHPRDAGWRQSARVMAGDLLASAPAPLRPTLLALQAASDDWLEQQADCLLTNVMQGLDLAAAPIIAGALQVYFARLVSDTQQRYAGQQAAGFSLPFGRTGDPTSCPCCGSRPTAGITRLEPALQGQRYLACSLCPAQWHMVRIQCSHCQSTKGIAYEALQPQGEPDSDDAADGDTDGHAHADPRSAAQAADEQRDGGRAAQAVVQAEICDECGHYLKLMHMDRDPNVDPIADDLATLTLDLLVAESGRQRHGVNLMLLFGDPGADAQHPPAEPPGDPGGD